MKGMNLVTKKEYASIEYNTDSLLGLCPRFLQVSPKMCCRILDLNLRPDNQRGRITRQIPNPKMRSGVRHCKKLQPETMACHTGWWKNKLRRETEPDSWPQGKLGRSQILKELRLVKRQNCIFD